MKSKQKRGSYLPLGKKGKWGRIVVLIFIIGIAWSVYFFFYSNDDVEEKEDTENLNEIFNISDEEPILEVSALELIHNPENYIDKIIYLQRVKVRDMNDYSNRFDFDNKIIVEEEDGNLVSIPIGYSKKLGEYKFDLIGEVKIYLTKEVTSWSGTIPSEEIYYLNVTRAIKFPQAYPY